MVEVAARRGFTSEEMADRLVPTLGLGADGSMVLDYGPRAFRVGFDEQLAPYVLDAAGVRRRDLPKPGKQDDAELAQASLARWKIMKKDARAIAKLEIARLELALSNDRRWRPGDFHTLLVQHPLLMNLVQRWVWGAFTPGGDQVLAFRVAEDGTYADVDDALVERAAVAGCEIGLLHPLRLDAASHQRWSQCMLDYGILQPFLQLGRRAYGLEAGEGHAHVLERFTGKQAHSSELRALLKHGWYFSTPADGGMIDSIVKPIAADLLAELHLNGDLNVLYWDGVSPTQTIDRVELRRPQGDERLRLRDLSPVIASEVIADVTRTLAEQEASEESGVSDVS